MTRRTVIESLATYVPERRLSTQEVVSGCSVQLDLPVERMTGIKSRRVAGEGEYSIDLAAKALSECLGRSAYRPDEIELLICCNISRCDGPDFAFQLRTVHRRPASGEVRPRARPRVRHLERVRRHLHRDRSGRLLDADRFR